MEKNFYSPSEDSYLLQKVLENYLKKIRDKNIPILDMGSGSGIQAQACRNLGFNNLLAADINKQAVAHLKKQKFKSVYSDLFLNINKNKKEKQEFNLIIFNPPYLPEDKYDKEKDTTAGKHGYETIIRFLKQARKHLAKKGAILLLFSSLSKPDIIGKEAEKLGYKARMLASKKLFFEEIFVYILNYNHS